MVHAKDDGRDLAALSSGRDRLTSDIVIEKVSDGKRRREKPGLAPGGRWTELGFLFSADTGELLAIMHGRAVSPPGRTSVSS